MQGDLVGFALALGARSHPQMRGASRSSLYTNSVLDNQACGRTGPTVSQVPRVGLTVSLRNLAKYYRSHRSLRITENEVVFFVANSPVDRECLSVCPHVLKGLSGFV